MLILSFLFPSGFAPTTLGTDITVIDYNPHGTICVEDYNQKIWCQIGSEVNVLNISLCLRNTRYLHSYTSNGK